MLANWYDPIRSDPIRSDPVWSDPILFFYFPVQSFFPAMTKIVGTLGPKSRTVEVISSCLKAGMSGTYDYCKYIIHNILSSSSNFVVYSYSNSYSSSLCLGCCCSCTLRFLMGKHWLSPGNSWKPQDGCQDHQKALCCKSPHSSLPILIWFHCQINQQIILIFYVLSSSSSSSFTACSFNWYNI